MKQIALLSLLVLAGILLIQGSNPFTAPEKGITIVEEKPVSETVVQEAEPEMVLQIDQELAERLVDEALARFEQNMNEAYRNFEDRVNSAFERAQEQIRSKLKRLVEDKIDRWSVFKQTVRMGADIVSGGDRAQRWTEKNFENPLRPMLEEFVQEISQARHKWVLDRDAAVARLESSFLTEIPMELEETAQKSLSSEGSILGGPSNEGNRAAASLGLTAVATGVFIKSDMADLKRAPNTLKSLGAKSIAKLQGLLNSEKFHKIIGKRLMPIAKRYAKKIAASGILVVADGPLPIGDLIAVVVTGVSSLWTVYEVWSLGSGAREDIMNSTAENFENLKKEVRADVIQPVHRDYQALLQSTGSLKSALLNDLAEL